MKSELQKMLEEKASTIIRVSYLVDDECTLLDKEYIYELIKKIDIDFYKKIIKKEVCFIYGDKFFAPLNKSIICIPKDSNFKRLKEICNDQMCKEIILIYKKLEKNFTGYFNIVE